MADKHLGQLAFVRIYSGTVKSGSYVYTIKSTKERACRLTAMHANKREDVETAGAGEIVAIGEMKSVTTDTIPRFLRSRIDAVPGSVVRVAVGVAKNGVPTRTRWYRFYRLAQEDPLVLTDHETGQTIIAGMGELHLEIIVDRMKREFGVETNVGKPQVAFVKR